MRSIAVLLVLAVVLGIPMPASAAPASSPLLWLRADAGVQSTSSKVYQWDDQSGNGKHATMTVDARKPTLVSGALNGLPVIRFGGAQSLNLLNPASPTAFTVFIVGKNSKATETFSMILGPGGSFPNNQLRWENGSQALFVGTGNNLPVITSTIGNTRVYHVLSARYDGSVLKVYRNGNPLSSHSFTTSGPWTLSNVGAWYSTYFMTGDLAEVLIYSRALTETERSQTNTYLGTKYGLPYGTSCPNGLCEPGFGESCSTCTWDCSPCPTCDYDSVCDLDEDSTCSDCCGGPALQTDGDFVVQPCEPIS